MYKQKAKSYIHKMKKKIFNNRFFHNITCMENLILNSWGVQKSFPSLNDPLCEFLKFPRRVQKIISLQNGTNRDLFKYISS